MPATAGLLPSAGVKLWPLLVPVESELSIKPRCWCEGTQAAPAGPPKYGKDAAKPRFERCCTKFRRY